MVYLYYHLKMELIKRKARTIPFGYKLADDTDYLEPIEEEIKALEQAIKYLESCSYREVANWLKQKTGRPISHVGLKKIFIKWKNSNHQSQEQTSEEKEEKLKEQETTVLP